MVEQPGQFSMRGGVLDIYPSTENGPVRLEFFGDEIDSLRAFDPASQRSHGAIPAVTLYPAREILLTPERVERAVPLIRDALKLRLMDVSPEPIRLPGEDGKPEDLLSPADRLTAKIGHEIELLQQRAYFNGVEYYLPYLYPEGAILLDYLPEETAVMLDEPEHLAHAFHRFREGLAQVETSRLNRGALLPLPHPLYLSLPDGLTGLARFPEVAVSLLPPGADASFTAPPVKSVEQPENALVQHTSALPSTALLDGALVDLACLTPVNYALAPDQLHADLQLWLRDGYVVAAITHQEHRMAEQLTGMGLPTLSGTEALPHPGTTSPGELHCGAPRGIE